MNRIAGILCASAILLGSVSYPAQTPSTGDGGTVRATPPQTDSAPAPRLELEREIAEGPITALAFSPQGRILAAAIDGHTIQFLNFKTGQVERTLRVADPQGRTPARFPDGLRVMALTFSSDGQRLAGAGKRIQNNLLIGGEVRWWDVPSGQLQRTIPVTQDPATFTESVAFAPDGQSLFVGLTRYEPDAASGRHRPRGEVSEWDAQTGERQRLWKSLDQAVHSVAISPDGQQVATGGDDGQVKLWDLKTGDWKQTLSGTLYRIFSLTFSPDRPWLASCVGPDLPGVAGSLAALQSVYFWHMPSGRVTGIPIGPQGFVTAVAFSSDGQHLASGAENVKLWRIR